MKKISKQTLVLKYYPNAVAINVGCKSGDYFHIMSGMHLLGQGKSKQQAWAAAYNNMND
jgi:hypothetical protein